MLSAKLNVRKMHSNNLERPGEALFFFLEFCAGVDSYGIRSG